LRFIRQKTSDAVLGKACCQCVGTSRTIRLNNDHAQPFATDPEIALLIFNDGTDRGSADPQVAGAALALPFSTR